MSEKGLFVHMKIAFSAGHSFNRYVRLLASLTQLAHSKVLQLATLPCSAHRLAQLTGSLGLRARSANGLARLTGSLGSRARLAHGLAWLTGSLGSRARLAHRLAPLTGSLQSQAGLCLVRAGVDGGWMTLATRLQ